MGGMRGFISALVVAVLASFAPTAAHAGHARYQPADQGHAITQHAEDAPASASTEAPAEAASEAAAPEAAAPEAAAQQWAAPARHNAVEGSVAAFVDLFGPGVEAAIR